MRAQILAPALPTHACAWWGAWASTCVFPAAAVSRCLWETLLLLKRCCLFCCRGQPPPAWAASYSQSTGTYLQLPVACRRLAPAGFHRCLLMRLILP